MKQYSPKSHGLTYLRHAIRHGSKKLKYVTIPMDKAQEILDASNGFQPSQQSEYSLRSNSLKGAAVVLAMDAKELLVRLNSPHPANVLNDLAEAKSKLKALCDAGDALVNDNLSKQSVREWVRIKSL